MRYLIIILILSVSSFVYAVGFGINSRAADFEEDNSEYFTVADSVSTDISSSLTMAAWVKVESAVEDGARIQIFNKYHAAGSQASYLFDYRRNGADEQLLCLVSATNNGSSQTVITVNFDLLTDTWFRVLCVYDDPGDFIAIFVNGVEQGRTSPAVNSINNSSNDLEIGNNTHDASQDPWDGLMDDVILYSKALSAEEIRRDYENKGQKGITSDVVGYWPMNEASGDRFDRSPNGNTAIETNSVTSTTDTAFKTVNGSREF